MPNGGWIVDSNDEAIYIDVDRTDDNDEESKEIHSQWADLPDLLLEEIFSYLTVRERYYASLVCCNWYSAFYMPRVWDDFIVDDRTLTRAKFNYYSGWQYVLDHMRTQNCLQRIGPMIRGLDFRPIYSFNNLFQFMTLIAWCMEQAKKDTCTREVKNVGRRINKLTYVFPCNMASADDPDGVKLFGTGGQLLAALKRLLSNLCQLKTLKLIDLMLERYEAKHLLDEVLDSCCLVLTSLHLVNVTSVHCPIMHIGLFLNLQVLVISPQSIDDDVLLLLADSKLKHLHLYQNRYTPKSLAISPCSAKAWRIVKRDNTTLKVHLRVESTDNGDVVLQPEAPVASVVYKSPKFQITATSLLQIIDMYKATLTSYGHEQLPHYQSPKSFNSRVDSLLVLMARQVINLTNLIIREKISTCTVLLIARHAPNLQQLYVRRNAVILKCDWPRNPDWDDDFYNWLKFVSKSYAETEAEVSRMLGYRWAMLSDQAFKKVNVNVRHA